MKFYVVDAFTSELFKGNPAAVAFADHFPSDELMQQIAIENRLSETAFAVVTSPQHYDLRWFTPGGEIDLCGHATLATGFLTFKYYESAQTTQVTFQTKSGPLVVTKKGDLYELNFPSYELKSIPVTPMMQVAFGSAPAEAYLGRDLLCVFNDSKQIRNMQPNVAMLEKLPGLLQHVTAQDDHYDCVSRSFGPKLKITEDPVCGSGHCHIVPYWAKKLDKVHIIAYQASQRGGILDCTYEGAQTKLAGHAVQYLNGELNL